MSHQFLLGKCLLELAQKPSRVALAWHLASGSTPYGVTDEHMASKMMFNFSFVFLHISFDATPMCLALSLPAGIAKCLPGQSLQMQAKCCFTVQPKLSWFSKCILLPLVVLLGRGPRKNCKNDLDDQT